jgi:hypothetical protein
MKFLLIIFTLLFSNIIVCSQQSSDQWVHDVFKEIVNAIGNNSIESPNLEIKIDGNSLAYYSPKNVTVYIDKKAIEICKEFKNDSANCLAFILGHELIHHYMQHGWINRDLRKDFKEFSFMENLKTLSRDSLKRLEMESQADLKGGFYTFLAGYNSLDIAPQLLDSLYKRYDLPKQSKNYPSLYERKQIVFKQIEKLERLKDVFDASTYALMAGYYTCAEDGFSKILSEGFNSKEIYNNLGISFLLDAIKRMDNESILGYPFEFDAESRLNDVKTRAISNYKDSEKIKKIILKGIRKFEQAISLDNKYQTAQLNICCAYSLIGELYVEDEQEKWENIRLAKKALNEFIEILIKKYAANNLDLQSKYRDKTLKTLYKNNNKEYFSYCNISSILLSQEGNKSFTKQAKKNLSKAVKLGDVLASMNLAKLNDTSDSTKHISPPSAKEIIEDYNPGGLIAGFSDFPEPFKVYRLKNSKLYVKNFDNSTAYLFNSRKKVFIHATSKQSTNNGININDHIKTIKEKYKNNFVVVSGTPQNFYKIDYNKLVFIEKNNKVIGWLTHQIDD